MGSTIKTEIGLSQFSADDEPSWLGDYNTDMQRITDNIVDLKNVTATVIAARLDLHDTQISNLTDTVTKNTSDIAVNTSSIAANAMHLNKLDVDIKALDTREQGHYDTLAAQVDGQIAQLDAFQAKQAYFEQNMNKTEAEVTILTASVAQQKLKIDALESRADDSASDISDLDSKVSAATAKVDAMETQVRNNTTTIAAHGVQINDTKDDISTLQTAVNAIEDKLPGIDTNADDIDSLESRMDVVENVAKTNSEKAAALETVTANIKSGVEVPFGFGINASGNQGYLDDTGKLNPFVTPQEYQDLLDDIAENMQKITELQEKTKNLLDQVKVPFNFGIADGGAYGYIPNGQLGVVPWLNADDVKSIVNIQPLQAAVQTVSDNVDSLSSTVDSLADNVQTVSNSVDTLSTQQETLSEDVSNISENLPDVVTANGSRIRSYTGGDDYTVLRVSHNHAESHRFAIRCKKDEFATITLHGSTDNTVASPSYDIMFGFGIDANGNYGYKKVGADTVTPFLNKLSFAKPTNNATWSIPAGVTNRYLPMPNIAYVFINTQLDLSNGETRLYYDSTNYQVLNMADYIISIDSVVNTFVKNAYNVFGFTMNLYAIPKTVFNQPRITAVTQYVSNATHILNVIAINTTNNYIVML